MKGNYLWNHLFIFIAILFVFNNVFAQESSCDNALKNAIKLYNARDFQNAKKAFEIGQKNCDNKKVFQEWINKCDDNIKAPTKIEKTEKPNKPEITEKQTPAKPVQQNNCETYFNYGKKTYDNASDANAYQNALAFFKKGLDEKCDSTNFSYWINICRTKIDYFNATLSVSPTPFEFSSSMETKELNITTNFAEWDWKYYSFAPITWVTIKKNKNSLTITCEENFSLKSRIDYFQVIAGCKTERIEIIQNGRKDLFPVVKNLLASNLSANTSILSNLSIKYKGETSASGHRNGLGAQMWSNGGFSFGVFSNGECTNGIYIDGDPILLDRLQVNKYQVGNFINSKLNGSGRTYSDDGVLTYMGDFTNDDPSYGHSYWRNNLQPELRFDIIKDEFGYYIGETKNGEPHGKGIFIKNNKDMWYGEWLNGEKSYGIELKFDGTVNPGTDF